MKITLRNLITTALTVFAILLLAEYASAKTSTEVTTVQLEQILVNKSPWVGEWFRTDKPHKTGDMKLRFENNGGKLVVRAWKNLDEVFGSPKDVLIEGKTIKFIFRNGRVTATLQLTSNGLLGKLDGDWNIASRGDERDVKLTPESDKPKEDKEEGEDSFN